MTLHVTACGAKADKGAHGSLILEALVSLSATFTTGHMLWDHLAVFIRSIISPWWGGRAGEGETGGYCRVNSLLRGPWAPIQFNRLMMDLETLALSLRHLSLSKEK